MIQPLASKPTPHPVTNAEYLALSQYPRGDARRIMSRSDLRKFDENPRKWVRGSKDEETTATQWGSLIDCLVTTPEQFETVFAVAPAQYLAKGKKKGDPEELKTWNWNATSCKEWREEAEATGKTVIKFSEKVDAQTAVRALHEEERFTPYLRNSSRQVLVLAESKDAETGLVVPLRCLVDIVPDGSPALCDLKTTGDASERSWARSIDTFGYDWQAALYLDCWNVATGEKRDRFIHLVQESEPPYETALWQLSEEFIERGRAGYQSALRDYCQCLKLRNFPGYERKSYSQQNGVPVVEPTPYMLKDQPI